MVFCLRASGEVDVFGRLTGRLLILVIAIDETMKNTNKKKMTSIIGMISIRARFEGLCRIFMAVSISLYFDELRDEFRPVLMRQTQLRKYKLLFLQ